MPAPTSSPLTELVLQLVPHAAGDAGETARLVEFAQEILSSNIAQAGLGEDMNDISHLMQRHLSRSSSSPTASLRLTNLLSRLYDQPVLSRKYAALNFLYTLSQQDPPSSSPISPAENPTSRRAHYVPPPSRNGVRPPTALDVRDGGEGRDGQQQQSKAALLRAYRLRIGKSHVPTSVLLRDAIYLLEGISGQHVRFITLHSDSLKKEDQLEFVDTPNGIVPPPTRALLHRIAELGHLHRLITRYLEERGASSSVGLIEQSFHHQLRTHLTAYHQLIALLETHASRSKAGEDGGGLTLVRMEAWVGEWRLRLRLMSALVEESRGAHGGKLVSVIHQHTADGDPFIEGFTSQILSQVSKPFFTSLQEWLFLGSLNDPFGEFFVAPGPGGISGDGRGAGEGEERPRGDSGGVGEAHRTWYEKWEFRRGMMPSFLEEGFGRKVYSTGKSLNFIRYNCHDEDWVTQQSSVSSTSKQLKYSDMSGLEQSIDAAYRAASQRLFDAFFVKYKLMDHIRALRDYLLCGYGDFTDVLMESLAPILSKTANNTFRHMLTARLLDAVKCTNAQYDSPDVVRRLDVAMLEYSHGELGWDVFTLRYKVDPPIDTVLHPEAMTNYFRAFRHLWKLRRIEGGLSTSWARAVGGARTFLRVPELSRDWHQARVVLAEMVHFVRHLLSWCHREVIGGAWKELMDFVQKREGDLDTLIGAHDRYVERIVKKALLASEKRGKEEQYLEQVQSIFSVITQFQDSIDDLWRHTIHEAQTRDLELDPRRGVYSGDTRPAPSRDALPNILARVRDFSGKFSSQVSALVHALAGHPDEDVRFLSVSLTGFGGFYTARSSEGSKG